MYLFEQKIRTLQGAAGYNADIFSYYNDSARIDVGRVRDMLEIWFSKYPEEEKEDLKSRMKAAFDPAYFELFIYVLFSELGYTLEVHPDLPNTSKHPDYLAKRGEEFFYIEVKHLNMLTENEQGLERRKNTLLDAINKTDASNFLLDLQKIIFKDNSQPSGKKIISFINKELQSLNPDTYTSYLEKEKDFDAIPVIVYEDEKVLIEFRPLPKVAHQRGTQSRSIASHPAVTKTGNDSESIRSGIESKALHYGRPDAPFILCLNKQYVYLDKIELAEAMYGNLRLSWSNDPHNRDEKLMYDGRGAFGSKNNPKLTRLSGVYVTNCNPANLAMTAEHTLRVNFHAKYPLSQLLLDSINLKTVKEILHVNDNYPGD